MKTQSLPAIIATLLISALLSACSSSNDTPIGSETPTEPALDTAPDITLPDTPDLPETPGTSGEPGTPETPDTTIAPANDDISAPVIDGGSDNPAVSPVPDTPIPEMPVTDTPPADESAAVLRPRVVEGGDLDRLIRAVTRQVSRTLLDLNARLATGMELTEQQSVCLGTYDPAQGEQLLAVDCEQALATGTVAIYVESAGFFHTSACHNDVFNGESSSCVLEYARVSVPTQWVIPELPADSPPGTPQRPVPIAGLEIYYAIDNTELRIENAAGALTGFFRCDLDLQGNEGATIIPGQSCAGIIQQAANRLDALLPE